MLWSTPTTVLDHAGWGAGPRGGLLSHEVHLKDRSPQLLPSGLTGQEKAPKSWPAACVLVPLFLLRCLLFSEQQCHFHCGKARISSGGTQGGGQPEIGVGAQQGVETVGGGQESLQKEGERGREAAQSKSTRGSKLGPK